MRCSRGDLQVQEGMRLAPQHEDKNGIKSAASSINGGKSTVL
jgi:hypothetical protein